MYTHNIFYNGTSVSFDLHWLHPSYTHLWLPPSCSLYLWALIFFQGGGWGGVGFLDFTYKWDNLAFASLCLTNWFHYICVHHILFIHSSMDNWGDSFIELHVTLCTRTHNNYLLHEWWWCYWSVRNTMKKCTCLDIPRYANYYSRLQNLESIPFLYFYASDDHCLIF